MKTIQVTKTLRSYLTIPFHKINTAANANQNQFWTQVQKKTEFKICNEKHI